MWKSNCTTERLNNNEWKIECNKSTLDFNIVCEKSRKMFYRQSDCIGCDCICVYEMMMNVQCTSRKENNECINGSGVVAEYICFADWARKVRSEKCMHATKLSHCLQFISFMLFGVIAGWIPLILFIVLPLPLDCSSWMPFWVYNSRRMKINRFFQRNECAYEYKP